MNDTELRQRLNELLGTKVSSVKSWSKTIGGKEYEFRITQTKKTQGIQVQHFFYTNFCDSKDGSFSRAITTKSLQSPKEVEESFIPFFSA
jgi:hypothetical protein